MDILNHFILLQTYVQHWNKFDQSLTPHQPPIVIEDSTNESESTDEKILNETTLGTTPHKSYRKPKPPPPAGATPLHKNNNVSVKVSSDSDKSHQDSNESYHDTLSDVSESEEELLGRQVKAKGKGKGKEKEKSSSQFKIANSEEDEEDDDEEKLLVSPPPIYMDVQEGVGSRDPLRKKLMRKDTQDSVTDNYLSHSSSSYRRHNPLSPPSSPPPYHETTKTNKDNTNTKQYSEAPPPYDDNMKTIDNPSFHALALALNQTQGSASPSTNNASSPVSVCYYYIIFKFFITLLFFLCLFILLWPFPLTL